MDDPLNKTKQQQIDEELQQQAEEFGDYDPDEKSSEVVDVEEAMEEVTGNAPIGDTNIAKEVNRDELDRHTTAPIEQPAGEFVPEKNIDEEIDAEDINSPAGASENAINSTKDPVDNWE